MRIGIDLGGSKIELVALDDAGATLHRERIATPTGDYAATIEAIAALVERAERAIGGQASVGIGTPGSRSPATGRMRNANSTCLNGRALDRDLATRLGRELRIANDANCLAVSEATDGAGAGARCVFGVILGTGVGGGIVVDGQLLTGANAIAGEWGHVPLPAADAADTPARRCYCGRTNCIETWLSGPGVVADHAHHTGLELDVREIVRAAEAGEQCAEATLERFERRLARALASVINVLDPDVIVLGGGLSSIARLYRNVPRLWREHIFSDVVETRLAAAAHGDASGVRGAAWLWPLEDRA
ncbi:ROK family protein [Pseudazoarcus pumilus]|uniref:Fructokinase n=1 Tax=Pseudazoarcus pumilus TaxID=2067960 RepID=A0A2I6SAH6_9RHOO|nr:ROK family protein [Pseudazoarcus pumilus]AUN96261.1 fructokinase [Pseudazoarcus pumilus]